MKKQKPKIRYAVVGLGYISQAAVLPAFKHANNSELVALVSGDPEKLRKLSTQYQVPQTYLYEDYEECLRSGDVDAVYIALPNHMHSEFTLRAAYYGVHVLCEKPMAVFESECHRMIEAAEENHIKLMIAYRLHFEKTNLEVLKKIRAGVLGEPRIFNSLFTMQVTDDNIRLKANTGGGNLYDIGIYCLNAARNIFEAEPIEVAAFTANNGESRFREVNEMTSVILRFPEERLATFTCSFGAADTSSYEIIGTKGSLKVDPAYEMVEALQYRLKVGKKESIRKFSKRDQFAPELIYFSDCILRDENPEPSAIEGLADIRVIEALYESAHEGRIVRLAPQEKYSLPSLKQEIHRPPVRKKQLIHATAPTY